MIGTELGIDWGLLREIYLGLVLFGIGYNALVAWAERKGYLAGYMSLVVALGVTVTVSTLLVISPVFVGITLGAFLASGLPMIMGSITRYIRRRDEMLRKMRAEATHEYPNEEMAS